MDEFSVPITRYIHRTCFFFILSICSLWVIPPFVGSAGLAAELGTARAGMGCVSLLLVPWLDEMMPPGINELLTAALLKCKVYVAVVPELQPVNSDRLSVGQLLLPNWWNRLWAKNCSHSSSPIRGQRRGLPLDVMDHSGGVGGGKREGCGGEFRHLFL